ncbi:M23 family metallopeptidase [uncultured Ruminobacter sp.]|uniref:M23 family metallopeptidase n=1 Tax=Ruminobacter sp. TaxID=2774296 RepID=UPI0025CF57D8|nr:M23 family metallopeptidase [uncultured Ruminobacter sp.]
MKSNKLFSVVACLLISVAGFGSAEGKILRYVDENGVVYYTDDENSAQSSGYQYDSYDDWGEPDQDKVSLSFDPKTHKLYIVNEFASEVTVKIKASDKSLIKDTNIPFDEPIEIEGNQNYLVGYVIYGGDGELTLSRTFDIGKIFRGSDTFYYTTNPNELIVPFKGAYKVTQGWEGGFTHQGPKNRYAIDVSMPVGTPVLAAKKGKVVDMRMGSVTGGNNPSFRPMANYIRIQHDDGTITVYVHLKGNSQVVRVGDYVQQGQVIALSGNTGYTTGPHLHFALQTNTPKGVKSIKFKLNGVEPVSGTLLRNK